MAYYRDTDNHIYSPEDCLGSGATGDVFRGIHKTTGEHHALKMFDPRYTGQIMREVEALLRLQHPNITKFYNMEKDYTSKKSVLVMELCEKGNLLEVIREPQNNLGLSEDEFLRFFSHTVSGMKHLRLQGFSHRDIKPGNILVCVDDDGSSIYKLSDFGTAKPLEDGAFFQSLVGTEEYLHPDIFRAAFIDNRRQREFNISADLWSLGATIFHASTGRVPFQPYGGRMDKATMYNMISKKESGVISGIQSSPGGPIDWSKELPTTCRYSRYLKDTLREMLVRLLECHGHRMWTFDGFFVAADELLNMNRVHVFTTCNFQHSSVYLSPKASLHDFKLAAAEQTETLSSIHHYDLHGYDIGVYAENRPDGAISMNSLPKTSGESPIVISDLECQPETSTCQRMTDLEFWLQYAKNSKLLFNMEASIFNTDEDYRMSKKMCLILAKISQVVSHTAQSVPLLQQAIRSCRCQVHQSLEKISHDRENLRMRFEDIDSLIEKESKSVIEEFTTITTDGEIAEDDRTKVRNRLNDWRLGPDLCQQYRQENNFSIDKAKEDELQKMKQQSLRLFYDSESLLQKFAENRKKTALKYHEQQFHRFGRLNMQNLYEKGMRLAEKAKTLSTEISSTYLEWNFRFRMHYVQVCSSLWDEVQMVQNSISEIVQNMKGIHEPPLPSLNQPSLKQRQLAYSVKKRVNGIRREVSESKSLVQETREHIENLSTLMEDLPTLEATDFDLETDLQTLTATDINSGSD